ncbi:hypothetical protein PGT21_002733 [Puccinia graminis f. sp. tritici]|uniref:Uncharacterized protein n=1 Tax=Puccinia graminis f. sp. tritici TaxID=56615 RepID=A0A5B0MA34_PUCGR|nr:hypothetical protein PGT21_002733 [Puccinia graminis f. sp. tritici]
MSHSNHDPLTGYLKPSKYGNSHNNNYQNNQMIQNPGTHGNWAHQQHNNYQPYNHNQNRNQNNTYQQNNSNNPNNQSGNKQPRGGYRGGAYAEGFQGKSDGNQAGRKGNPNNKM